MRFVLCCLPVALRAAELAHAQSFSTNTALEGAAERSLAAAAFHLHTGRAAGRHVCVVLQFVCFGVDMC